jgi:protein SCO1/2
MNRRAMLKPILAAALLSISLAACAPEAPTQLIGTDLQGAAIGGSFTLTDKDGKTVRWEDFAGKYRIVYFGFTFCPDACPTDMRNLMQGFAKFEKAHPGRAAKVQPLFVSIDPARDTPARVGEFAAAFHPRLIGLTGSPKEIDRAAKAFKAYYARGADMPGGYNMDHSRIAYLMGPDGKPIEGLPIEQSPDAVAADLAAAVK